MLRVVSALLLSLFLPVTLIAGDGEAKSALSESDIHFLARVLTLTPGMSEADLRTLFPKLGSDRAQEDQSPGVILDLPEFSLAGLKWVGRFRMTEGNLSDFHLYASAWYPLYRHVEPKRQAVPREEVRAAGLAIAAWFQQRIGRVTERYVPNMDCPAGNPFGLRHTWLTRGRAVAVEFRKNASMSNLELSLADWSTWNQNQKQAYSESWPLKPARPENLREAASPQR